MKNVLATSLVLGGISLGVSLYCYQWVTPSIEAYERILPQMNLSSDMYAKTRDSLLAEYEKEQSLSLIAMISGTLGLLGGVFSGMFFKKWNSALGWLTAVVSLVGLLLGIMTGTHLFS
mgnify:CR=1 FL=1